ncbi:molybdopterin synthase sulfur carrier subunit [Drosophila nasuta]|uniref:Molybdopterin synthase sulfur carrier subunit n=1 Tax=Drosophila albomicans TaxID=7291 RepID=A0A6P8XWF2_DROAB|nr:molybdopterin synthase sulfur carrier subunit [Drosophila albomicans]XP_060649627.1 molybdopterin synthase sulfur carrier subunit [Drosophila nasuta]
MMSVENSETININVLFFAKSRELAKTSRAVFAVESVVKTGQLLKQLIDRFDLSAISNCIILAHNENYLENLDEEIRLQQGDEIAVIPPISGG